MIDLVIFDWKRTLYDPDSKTLIEGARTLLDFIKSKNITIVLIGKGGDDMNEEVERLGVKYFFKKIVFAKGDKDPNVFAQQVTKDDPKKTVFIGDRVRSELEIGNKLGATTIWVKQGKFAQEESENKDQEPDYIVSDLKKCLEFISSLN